MNKKKYVVRIVQCEGDNTDMSTIVECLRYAGLVTVHETDPNGLTTLCFDVPCPYKDIDSKDWAERNAARMKTFGLNAVSAPSTTQG